MDTTSPSKKMMRMNNQENRTVRERNCNSTPPEACLDASVEMAKGAERLGS